MPEGEAAQERPQRRGCFHPRQHIGHRTLPQHRKVVDAVGAGEHPGDHGGDLRRGIGSGSAGDLHQGGDQVRQAGPAGPAASPGTSPAELIRLGSSKVAVTLPDLRELHLADGFLFRIIGGSDTHHFPSSAAIRHTIC